MVTWNSLVLRVVLVSVMVVLVPVSLAKAKAMSINESKLQSRGRVLGARAEVKSYICVELELEKQPWCLGEVVEKARELTASIMSRMGVIEAGDVVIDIQKLEPTSPGSRTFVKSDRIFAVHVENICMINIKMIDKTRGRSADQRGRFELSAETKATIDSIMYH